MNLFKKRKETVELPPVLMDQEDPVNYNTVLDYLVGLSKPDYEKMLKVSGIYRQANKEAARVIGIKDEPTVSLLTEKPSDEEIEDALDTALSSIKVDFEAPNEPGISEPVKEQAAKIKQVEGK